MTLIKEYCVLVVVIGVVLYTIVLLGKTEVK